MKYIILILFTFLSTLCFAIEDLDYNTLIHEQMFDNMAYDERTEYQELYFVGPNGGGGGPVKFIRMRHLPEWELVKNTVMTGPNGGGGGSKSSKTIDFTKDMEMYDDEENLIYFKKTSVN